MPQDQEWELLAGPRMLMEVDTSCDTRYRDRQPADVYQRTFGGVINVLGIVEHHIRQECGIDFRDGF